MADRYKRYYQIAGITIQVESDLPILDTTFSPAIREFEVQEAGSENVIWRHHFLEKCTVDPINFGQIIYQKPPWTISKKATQYFYQESYRHLPDDKTIITSIINQDYSVADFYHTRTEEYLRGGKNSLSFFPTDQVILAPLLGLRHGILVHSAGALINEKGVLFVGHSSAGKSTITRKLLKAKNAGAPVSILCDDRNIVRKVDSNWKVYGTWSHGDVPTVSKESADLNTIFFIHKSTKSNVEIISNASTIRNLILEHLIKAHTTYDWWDQTIQTISECCSSAKVYDLYTDKSTIIYDVITDYFQ